MTLIVQKFGGTSVGSIERIKSVANIVSHACHNGNKVIVVVSAMAGETDRLESLAQQIVSSPSPREIDVLMSTGEQVSMSLLAMALTAKGWKTKSLTGQQAGIITDSRHTSARIQDIKSGQLKQTLSDNDILVVAGFQGVEANGDITTLGRGGSDLTAVAIAAAMKAKECQIFTDVKGVYSSDPRIVPKARCLQEIPFPAMLELASVGAKVLQTRAVYYAGKYQVPLRVMSSFESAEGTKIVYKRENMESALVSGIAYSKSETKITFSGVPDKPGILAQIIKPLSDNHIHVDMMLQATDDNGLTKVVLSVSTSDVHHQSQLIEDISKTIRATQVTLDPEVCKLSVVGVGLQHDPDVAIMMLETLAKEGINILAISNSETRISVLIEEKYLELAARSLHSIFRLDSEDNYIG
jgi:aspartate kinase